MNPRLIKSERCVPTLEPRLAAGLVTLALVHRAYRSLALASASNKRSDEDRLTEIYAVALEAHKGFASTVFQHVQLPTACSYRAWTQYPVRGGRLDIRVHGVDSAGETVALLYGEHKEPQGRASSKNQRNKYLPALKAERLRLGVPGKLLWIVGSGDDPHRTGASSPARSTRNHARARRSIPDRPALRQRKPNDDRVDTTWQDIATWAEYAGRDSVDDDRRARWRSEAELPCAPASQRILRELLWYLEEKGYAVTEGLTDAQLTEALSAYDVFDTLEELIEQANIKTADHEQIGRFSIKRQRGYLRLTPASWIDKWSGRVSVVYDDGSSSKRAGSSELTVWLQVQFPRSMARELVERPAFLAQLKQRRVNQDLEAGGWIGMRTPLHKLIAKSEPILETQAAQIAKWAHQQFPALLELKPGQKPKPR